MKEHKAAFVKVAWGLIIVFVAGMAVLQALPEKVEKGDSQDPTGLVMIQLQGEYLLGVASLLGATEEIAQQASILDVGTVEQRQRFMAFSIALGDTTLAKQSALRMQTELLEQGRELSQEQAKVQESLDLLAQGSVLPEDSQPLQEQLGWFGALLEADASTRAQMEASAGLKVLIVGSMVSIMGLAAIAGFVMLVVLFVRTLSGSISTGLTKGRASHGIYAEVFALWLLLFVVLMSGAAILGSNIAEENAPLAMGFSLIAFFASLLALFWARFRGIGWSQIRSDIGWTRGRGLVKESLLGVVGYAMMLPILGVGVILVLVLLAVQAYFASGVGSDPFAGTSGGAHPIVLEIANGGWQVRILLVSLAAVAAPIVEETMFRGVLYRQLRTSSNSIGIALSIVLSILLTSFLFAAIHPQGWIAVPALMAIAIGMNLMREWRGTLLPSMIVHGVSNGIVTSMMLVFLS
ncbi:MAG: CPBP family intramembrane metalloprotease [Planctomycetes bacterium]|nr:CPBP family intramembrane metalloprotease [Planctomycetota bacterium]